ncbi:MAG: hypothetical protein WBG73_18620 [Coleofasciculaceae cyanobacterium]
MKQLQPNSLRLMALGLLVSVCGQLPVLTQASPAIAVEAFHQNVASPIGLEKTEKIASTMIGPAIDCDGDGKQNDARIDDDGDGIPDRCLLGSQAGNSQAQEIQVERRTEPVSAEVIRSEWKAMQKQLEECTIARRTDKSMTYSLCRRNNGQILQVSEALTEFGDGLGYWLRGDQIRAVQFFHSGEVWFFQNGRLQAILTDGVPSQVQTSFSPQELNQARLLVPNGHRKILQRFGL